MEPGDASYAPESPDLSAFRSFTPNPPPQHQQYRGSFSQQTSATAYQPPQRAQSHSQSQHQQLHYPSKIPVVGSGGVVGGARQQQQQQLQQVFPLSHSHPIYHEPEELNLAATSVQSQQDSQSTPTGRQNAYIPPNQSSLSQQSFSAYVPPTMGRRTTARPVSYLEEDEDVSADQYEVDEMDAASHNRPGDASAAGPEVKTKFPVARIKRIMQADEDVGKVAQVTPVVVSKALELFMISLVTKSADQARARSSKRVTAAHFKQAVLNDPQFDFLSDIVGKVADAATAKGDRGGDDSAEHGGDLKRRRTGPGTGRGRKKKEDADDDNLMV